MRSSGFSFRLLTLLFFMWGFITVMNDVLINSFKSIFSLSPLQRSTVQLAFFGAFFFVSLLYFLVSVRSGRDPVNRIGYARGMVISLLICGLGCALFYPAAQMGSYTAFILALFVLATGVTFLQICANPYAAILGSPDSASGRLNLAQGMNSLGTTLGPLVGTGLIYRLFSDGEATAGSVARAYLVYALLFWLLALMIGVARLPAFQNREQLKSGAAVLRFPQLRWGVAAIFLYVGAEVSMGSWLGDYLRQPHVGALGEEEANYYLAFFWGGLMIGRILATFALGEKFAGVKKYLLMSLAGSGLIVFIWFITGIKFEAGIPHFTPLPILTMRWYFGIFILALVCFSISSGRASRMLSIFSAACALMIGLSMVSEGELALWSMIGAGFFFSVGWSNIFTLAIRGLGENTSQGSSLLVMAIAGGAVIPRLQAMLSEFSGLQYSFVLPLLCVVFLVLYGSIGYRSGHAELDKC